MQGYIKGEILRLDIAQFTTNYIAQDSLLNKKIGLHKMFVNAEWQESRYVRVNTEGSTIENLAMRKTFWQPAEKIVKAIKPLYEVFRIMTMRDTPNGLLISRDGEGKASNQRCKSKTCSGVHQYH